jgi:cysteine synthase
MKIDIANSNVVIYTGPHQITGNGVGFKPDILDMDVMDKVLEVSSFLSSIYRDLG